MEHRINRIMDTLPATLIKMHEFELSGRPNRRLKSRGRATHVDDGIFRYRVWTPNGIVSRIADSKTLL